MKKCFILMKRCWGDFDIEIFEPILVSLDEKYVINEVNDKNNKLTREEIKGEIKYLYKKVGFVD